MTIADKKNNNRNKILTDNLKLETKTGLCISYWYKERRKRKQDNCDEKKDEISSLNTVTYLLLS